MKTNNYNQCVNAMQSWFLNLTHADYWFYSQMYYSELGYMSQCEQYASPDGAAYVQFTTNLTDFPMTIPVSLCVPIECNDVKYFQSMV